MARVRQQGRRVFTDEVLNERRVYLDFLRRVLRRGAAKGTTVPEGYVAVYDPDREEMVFAPSREAAQAFHRHGRFLDQQDARLSIRIPVEEKYVPLELRNTLDKGFGERGKDPADVPTESAPRRFVERLQRHLETGGTLEHASEVRKLKRDFELSTFEWMQVLQAGVVLEQQHPEFDFDALYNAANKQVHERIEKEGGLRNFLAQTLRAPHPEEVEWAAARGLHHDDVGRGEFWMRMRALKKREKAEGPELGKRLRAADKGVKEGELGDLVDLLEHGIGEKSLQRMRSAGITLAKLRAGQVTEDQLRRLGHVGDTKVERLKELGIPLIPSADTLKTGSSAKSSRARRLFGKGADPFAAEHQEPALVGRRTVHVRTTSGNIEKRVLESRLTQRWTAFKQAFFETVGRPFTLLQQYRQDTARQALREANQLVRTKHAASYYRRAEKARTGLGAQAARVLFHSERALATAIVAAVVLGTLLFLPVAILQLGGWAAYGMAAFVINAGVMVALSLVNVALTTGTNAINVLGYLLSSSLQAFLDAAPEVLGATSGSNTLPGYKPVPMEIPLVRWMDPNRAFPDCINTNTVGAILLRLAATLLRGFGAWLSLNGAFAVGASIILFLATPAYVLSRGQDKTWMGISVALLTAGLAMVIFPAVADLHIPVQTALLVTLLGGVVAGAAYLLSRDPAPMAVLMTLGVGVALVVGGSLVHDTWFADAASPPSSNTDADEEEASWWATFLGGSIRLSVEPVAGALGGAIVAVAGGLDYVADIVTTGWAKLLDHDTLDNLRNTFSLGTTQDEATTATAANPCPGG